MTENIYNLNTKNWQHKIGTIGELVTDTDDILQCYETIFKTQKGTVVCNPNLGWDFISYLAKPLNTIKNKMEVTLLQALNQQEPRAIATSAKFSYNSADDFAAGHLSVEITFIPNITKETNQGVFTL